MVGTFRRKQGRTKTMAGILLVIGIYLGLFAFMQWAQIEMMMAATEMGSAKSSLVTGFILAIFIAVLMALQKITGSQVSNDTEQLLAMPIRKSQIMIAKATSRYCLNLALVVLFALPSVIAYLVCLPFSWFALIGSLILILSIPLFSVGLSYMIDFLIQICLSNSKIGNILKAVFALIVLGGVIAVYELVSFNTNAPFITHIIDMIITCNPAIILPVILVGIISFLIGNLLFAKLLNHETRTDYVKAIKHSTNKKITPFGALLKNETNRYLNSPTLMINTFIGPLGIIALTIWLAIDRCQTFSMLCLVFGWNSWVVYILIAIAYGFMMIMTYPAAVSISMEGKQFWVIRSIPLKASVVLTAKVMFNILLVSPVFIICAIILQYILQFNTLVFIYILILPILLNMIVSFGGLMVNLFFPKFDYESDVAVIKQSLSSMLMLFGGLIIEILIGFLYFISFALGLPIFLAMLIPLILIAIITIGIITLTYTVGQRIFNRL